MPSGAGRWGKANFAFTAFYEVRPRKSCLTMLQVVEQMLDQEPVHLVYLDPTARVLDEAGPRPRPESAVVGDLELADIVQEIVVRLFGEFAIHGWTAYRPPTWMAGRRSGFGSASLKTSWVTGAVSPSPERR